MTNLPEGMNVVSNLRVFTVFHEGDEVVLAKGTYQGTPGVFISLREDVRWADITESDGCVRIHPVEWLAHPAGAISEEPGIRETTVTQSNRRVEVS
jgi:hypothetical protein